MLDTLLGLKTKSIAEQIQAIETLTERSMELLVQANSALEARSINSVFRISLANDAAKVVQAILLSVIAGDIASIPDHATRQPYYQQLEGLCQHFEIDPDDLALIMRFLPEIEWD